LKPDRLATDAAYGAGKFLGWLVGTGITPQIPVWNMSNLDVRMSLWRLLDRSGTAVRAPTWSIRVGSHVDSARNDDRTGAAFTSAINPRPCSPEK
jgi:hypothetical protein